MKSGEGGRFQEEVNEVGKEVFGEEMSNGSVGVRQHGSDLFQSIPRKGEKGALSQDVVRGTA